MRRKHGALAGVLRAIELDRPAEPRRARESVACDYCGREMHFGTDDLGRSTQRCSSQICPNRRARPMVCVHR